MNFVNKEHELIYNLIGSCNYSFKKSIIDSILINNLNWSFISIYARSHGLASILYKIIKDEKLQPYIPEISLNEIKNYYYFCISKNTQRINLYHTLEKEFNDLSIRIIPLKGIFLLKEIYDNIAIRPMSDIDFLVNKADLKLADNILIRSNFFRIPIRSKIEDKYLLNYNFQYFNSKIFIELHHALLPPYNNFNIDMENLWATRIFENNRLEFFIIHTCLHKYYNVNNKTLRLAWFYDLQYIIVNYFEKISWELIDEIAIKNKVENIIKSILFILYNNYNVQIPKWFIEKNNFNNEYQKQLLNFNNFIIENIKSVKIIKNYSLIQKFKQIKGLDNKITYLFEIIFPNKKYLKFNKLTLLDYWSKTFLNFFCKINSEQLTSTDFKLIPIYKKELNQFQEILF